MCSKHCAHARDPLTSIKPTVREQSARDILQRGRIYALDAWKEHFPKEADPQTLPERATLYGRAVSAFMRAVSSDPKALNNASVALKLAQMLTPGKPPLGSNDDQTRTAKTFDVAISLTAVEQG